MSVKEQYIARLIVPTQNIKRWPVGLDVRQDGQRLIQKRIKVGPLLETLRPDDGLAVVQCRSCFLRPGWVLFSIPPYRGPIGDVPQVRAAHHFQADFAWCRICTNPGANQIMPVDVVIAGVLVPGARGDGSCRFVEHLIHVEADRPAHGGSDDLGDGRAIEQLAQFCRTGGWKLIDAQRHGNAGGHTVRVRIGILEAFLQNSNPLFRQDLLEVHCSVPTKGVDLFVGDRAQRFRLHSMPTPQRMPRRRSS